jgi:hypothetical protein
MRRIKAFFYIYFKSLTSVRYYQDILKTDLGFSMKYFLILSLLVTFFVTLFTIAPHMPEVRNVISDFIEETRNVYPEELVFTVENGKMSINQPEPFIVPMSSLPSLEDTGSAEDFENFLVIDSQGTLNDFETYNTLMLINESNILVGSNGKIEVYPLRELPDLEITQETINELAATAEDFVRYIPYLILLVMLFLFLFYYLGFRLVYLLFVAMILYIIGRVRGQDLSFGNYYKIGLHTITLPLTVEFISMVLGVPVALPFWFFIINILFGIFVIISLFNPSATEREREETVL